MAGAVGTLAEAYAARLLAARPLVAGPRVAGLCGPQGSGKSTLAAQTAHLLRAEGVRVAVLSLDDLYLTRAQRLHLAATVHPLLATRGVPGTHDVVLGHALLDALAGTGPVRLPRFDKAADDRAPERAWERIDAPVDFVLFEGWCVGARPQPVALLDAPVNALERDEDADGRWRAHVNAMLAGRYAALWARLDHLALLLAPDWPTVVAWRRDAEAALRTHTGQGMSEAGITRFCAHYQRLTEWITTDLPPTADWSVALDSTRRPFDAEHSNPAMNT